MICLLSTRQIKAEEYYETTCVSSRPYRRYYRRDTRVVCEYKLVLSKDIESFDLCNSITQTPL